MLLRLVRPLKRSGSSVPYFAQRIPADVRAKAIGRVLIIPRGTGTVRFLIKSNTDSIRFSLRTHDASEAKVRQGKAAAYLETVWQALRKPGPLSLTHKQATALAGEFYRAWADDQRETIGILHTPQGWVADPVTPEEDKAYFEAGAALLDRIGDRGAPSDLERVLGPIVDQLLLAKAIASVDEATRLMLLEAFRLALRDAFKSRERNAEGDYSPDQKAQRFPDWQPLTSEIKPTVTTPAKASLRGLVEDWWREAKAAGRKLSTYRNYRNTMGRLVAFLGHDDASRVTPGDILRFKDHRLTEVSARTVMDNDLAGLKTVFDWAVTNHRMSANPARGISIKLSKPAKLRSKGFTDEEAGTILSATLNLKPQSRELPQTHAAKRWVPWLCAYTGARVGEIGQLRKEDVRKESGHWVIRISPEAGTVKTNEARIVPLHAHLIEQGFAEFVKQAPAGHLFLQPNKETGEPLGPLRGIKNRLAEFARKLVPDRNVAPNHGWRHRFKTVGMESGIDARVLDAIQGQAPRTTGETYGDVTVKTMAKAIAKLPRIRLEPC